MPKNDSLLTSNASESLASDSLDKQQTHLPENADLKNKIPPPLTLNRLSYQIVRHHHHSFKTKWHEIILQIFGRYGAIENEGTSLGHCVIVNEDVYRLHAMNWEKYLDPVKLANPFKYLEFLIVAPLEMLSFSFTRVPILYIGNFDTFPSIIRLIKPLFGLIYFSSFILDLAVNIITGSLRRCFLAPVRYIVRPAIEMAMKYPKLFVSVVAITASISLIFSFLLFTGSLSVVLTGSAFLTWTLVAKLTAISLASIWLGAMLTKGFDSIRDCLDIIYLYQDVPIRDQHKRFLKRDQQADYPVTMMKVDRDPSIEELCNHSGDVPLLIWNVNNNRTFIYGLFKGTFCLKPIQATVNYDRLFDQLDLYVKTPMSSFPSLEAGVLEKIYSDIYLSSGHVQKRTGYTKEITRVLHHIDVDHADIQPLETKKPFVSYEEKPAEKAYKRKLRLSYFFGVEAVVCPRKENRLGYEAKEVPWPDTSAYILGV